MTITEAITDYAQRVAAAPLLTEAELHAKAFSLLREHASMLDACMVGEQSRLAGDPQHEPVAKHIQDIREAVFEIGVLNNKRVVAELTAKAVPQ